MKNRSLIFLVGVFVVLLIVYLILNSARDVTFKAERFYDLDTTKITGFTIYNKEDTTQLVKSAGGWNLAPPIDYPADERFTSDMVTKLGTLEVETVVSEDTAKASLFEVDTSGVEIVVFQGADTVAHFIVGKTSQNRRNTYCRKIGEDKIYMLRGSFTGQLQRKTKDWRNKNILEIEKDLIALMEFKYPDETFSVANSDTGWTIDASGLILEADQKLVDRVAQSISHFRTLDFLDGDSARAVDFSQPDLKLTVTTNVGDVYRFSFVPKDKDANRYLIYKEGVENTRFEIHKSSANTIMKRVKDLEAKEEK